MENGSNSNAPSGGAAFDRELCSDSAKRLQGDLHRPPFGPKSNIRSMFFAFSEKIGILCFSACRGLRGSVTLRICSSGDGLGLRGAKNTFRAKNDGDVYALCGKGNFEIENLSKKHEIGKEGSRSLGTFRNEGF